MGILLDTNFHFKTEGYIRGRRRGREPYNLIWLEIDIHDPQALRADPRMRAHARSPPAKR